jgi:hypothetical protein
MKTVRLYGSLFLCFSVIFLSAGQSGSSLVNARALGFGNTSATLTDEWSLLNNVGGLSKVRVTSIAMAYEARPGLVGANRMAATFSVPVKIGTYGVGVFRFGDDLYNEQILSAGFGNSFDNTSLGVKVNYVQYRAFGFEPRTAISLNFGGITKLSSTVTIGAYITNINQPRLSTVDGERLPTQLVAGVSFKPTEFILLVTEIDKDLHNDPIVKCGLEYKIHTKIYARTGFNVQPEALFLGMGFMKNNLKIDYALQYTQNLNYAFQVSVIYQILKKMKKQDD